MRRHISIVLFALVVVACASERPIESEIRLSREELLRGTEFGLDHSDSIEPVDTLAMNDDMRRFLAEHIPAGVNNRQKVEHILSAILEGGLHLNYNNFKTLTAQEAFYQREANCLSFTNLFIALARSVGVDAKFQAVDIPPSWSIRGDTYLNNRHLNVVVTLTRRSQIVDFDMASYDSDYKSSVITDQEALAQFHNNMGAYWLGENNAVNAFLNFRRALSLHEQTGYFWTNLGTLYRRSGHAGKAEAAFKVAISIDNDAAAMSNLARLYDETGEPELSAYFASRVELFRRKNPYYLYDLAMQAYSRQNYSEAEQLVRVAIRHREDEHTFYQLLGLIYVQMEKFEKASKPFANAAKLAVDSKQRELYNRKLELLADS